MYFVHKYPLEDNSFTLDPGTFSRSIQTLMRWYIQKESTYTFILRQQHQKKKKTKRKEKKTLRCLQTLHKKIG